MKDWSVEVKEFYQDLKSECDTELDPKRFIFDQGNLSLIQSALSSIKEI
jgi:hypothetical protein